MFTSSYGPGGPDPEFLRRMSPPENEIPVAVPLDTVLARTADAAVALTSLHVYSTGLSVDLVLRVRAADPRGGRELGGLLFGHGPHSSPLLVGLEFSDGRRVTNTGPPFPGADDPHGVVFHPAGGSASDRAADQSWWLSPLPPPGPLVVVVRCEPLGIAETSTVIDGAAIAAAADRVVELWPWEPPPDAEPTRVRPPDVPGDSWFAQE